MPDTIVVTETYSTWAAANAARNRLTQSGGFQRFGIHAVNVERTRDDFELRIEADPAHRDDITHLLRSGAPLYTQPKDQSWPEPGLVSPVVMLGIAAAAGIFVYRMLSRGSRRQAGAERRLAWPSGEHRAVTAPSRHGRQHDADQRAGIRSHDEGYAL
jgi:hypothetical protein